LQVLVVLNLQASIEWTKAREFRRQQQELESDALVTCVRSGVLCEVAPRDVVVGDVVCIAVGDVVAVDGILLEGTDIKMDESALTGEPILVAKEADSGKDPFILSGTNAMTGSGKLVAVAVGINSVQGRIFAAVQGGRDTASAEKDRTTKEVVMSGNLEDKMDALAMDIGKGGLYVSAIAFLIMTVVYVSMPKKNLDGTSGVSIFGDLMDDFLVAVTILVVAVPEGLPLAVALCKAITMGKMMQDNNRVKHMDACETMGSATTICSDKTGTLTQNKMTVVRLLTADTLVLHDGKKDIATQLGSHNIAFLEKLHQCCVLGSAATSKVSRNDQNQWNYQGNATECALLKLCLQMGVDAATLRCDPTWRDPTGVCRLDWGVKQFPFSSQRKKMSWVVPLASGGFRLFTKGAPTYVINYAKDALAPDGSTTTALDQTSCIEIAEAFQRLAMRTLALAYRDFDTVPAGGWDAVVAGHSSGEGQVKIYAAECDVTLICIVGIEDPLRPTVTRAICQCNTAGVDVRTCPRGGINWESNVRCFIFLTQVCARGMRLKQP